MARFFIDWFSGVYYRFGKLLLMFSFSAGLLVGLLFYSAGNTTPSLMQGICTHSLSIVLLLPILLLPFLFSVIAVCLSQPWILLFICFGKSFLFSFISLHILNTFGTAGWIIRLLIVFSELFVLPIHFWFWNRHISGTCRCDIAEVFCVFSGIVLIGSIDCCYVSPFLRSILLF